MQGQFYLCISPDPPFVTIAMSAIRLARDYRDAKLIVANVDAQPETIAAAQRFIECERASSFLNRFMDVR